ncbi:MAG: transposase [Bdellovibrionales bacterium]|nr:transposase [Bdellovibrionales bacterium]
MARQPYLPDFEKLRIKDFGGSAIKGNAREARPLSTRRPLHLVLRSSLAKADRSFLHQKHRKTINALIHDAGKKSGVRIYRFANSGNHLHLVILPTSRSAYLRFIRSLTGRIARRVLGAERGRALGVKFWDALPFTRILEWGRDYRVACSYLRQNVLEALGFIPYRPRKPNPG